MSRDRMMHGTDDTEARQEGPLRDAVGATGVPGHDAVVRPTDPPEPPLSTALQEYRIRLGLSQEDLADKLQMSLSAVRSWENGQRTPNAYNLKKLIQALDLSPDEQQALRHMQERASRRRVPVSRTPTPPTDAAHTEVLDHPAPPAESADAANPVVDASAQQAMHAPRQRPTGRGVLSAIVARTFGRAMVRGRGRRTGGMLVAGVVLVGSCAAIGWLVNSRSALDRPPPPLVNWQPVHATAHMCAPEGCSVYLMEIDQLFQWDPALPPDARKVLQIWHPTCHKTFAPTITVHITLCRPWRTSDMHEFSVLQASITGISPHSHRHVHERRWIRIDFYGNGHWSWASGSMPWN